MSIRKRIIEVGTNSRLVSILVSISYKLERCIREIRWKVSFEALGQSNFGIRDCDELD